MYLIVFKCIPSRGLSIPEGELLVALLVPSRLLSFVGGHGTVITAPRRKGRWEGERGRIILPPAAHVLHSMRFAFNV